MKVEKFERGVHLNRSFVLYISLVVFTMMLGLLSRWKTLNLPQFVGEYVGDVLWALMVYWLFCLIFRRVGIKKIVGFAVSFSFGIELLQLYQEPWIQAIRHTTLGALVLGFGFKWEDLVCYSVGIGIGVLIEFFLLRKTNL